MKNTNIVFGRNPVTEVLKGDASVEKIIVQQNASGSIGKIIALAREKKIPIENAPKDRMDKIAKGAAHQGVICEIAAYEYAEFDEILAKAEALGGDALLLILDGIEDPHNLGAIMRTAECVGASGLVIPKNRSCGLTETVAKTSAGAIAHMPCAKVTNIARTIDELKEKGYWICGADMDGQNLWETDLRGKIAIVIGNEGNGISRLVKEKCDFMISIPMAGKINSLNASNAAAVLMYETMRQRRTAHNG